MSQAVVAIHFRDEEIEEEVREVMEKRCRHLADEFPEVTRLEVTLSPDGVGHAASGHAVGKSTEVATHAQGDEPRSALDRVLHKMRHQLRRTHDKRIFARRRTARRGERAGVNTDAEEADD